MGKYISLAIAILVSLVLLVVVLILAIRGCERASLSEQKQNQPKSTTEGASRENREDGKDGSNQWGGQPPKSELANTSEEGDRPGGADQQQDGGQAESEQKSYPGGGGLASQEKPGLESPGSSQHPAHRGESGTAEGGNGKNGEKGGKEKMDDSQAAAALERAERLRRRAEQSAQRGTYGRAYAEALEAWEMLRPAAKYDLKCRNLMEELERMLRTYGDLANQDYMPRPLDNRPLAIQNK